MTAKMHTGNSSRDILGVGSVMNVKHEGGQTNRRDRLEERLGEISSEDIRGGGKTPEDMKREKEQREFSEKQLELERLERTKAPIKGWKPFSSGEEERI